MVRKVSVNFLDEKCRLCSKFAIKKRIGEAIILDQKFPKQASAEAFSGTVEALTSEHLRSSEKLFKSRAGRLRERAVVSNHTLKQ